MNTAAVQEERGPRKPRSNDESKLKRTKTRQKIKQSAVMDQSVHELTAHILLITIKQIRASNFFSMLDRRSQDECLQIVWGPLFLLKAAQWPAFIPSGPKEFQTTILHIRSLSLDNTEVNLLEAIISCRKDLISNASSGILAEHLQKTALLSLAHHVPADRLNILLLIIPVLQTPSTATLDSAFFQPIIGPMSVENVIITI